MASGQPSAACDSAAMRRRQRRLRSWLRHERMTVAMALAEKLHHSAQRPEMARAGEWGRERTLRRRSGTSPTPQPELFSLYDEEPGGTRPERMPTLSGPQDRVLQHTVQQIVGTVPSLPTLDDTALPMVEQLPDILQFFRALSPDPEQVIEVPKILPEDVSMPTVAEGQFHCDFQAALVVDSGSGVCLLVLLVTMHLVLCSFDCRRVPLDSLGYVFKKMLPCSTLAQQWKTRASVCLPNLTHFLRDGGLLDMLRILAQCWVLLWIPFCVSHGGAWVISRFFA